MKKLIIFMIALCSSGLVYASSGAIIAINGFHKPVTFALDRMGTPRIVGDTESYASILFFTKDSFTDPCYVGDEKNVRSLLEELVMAADGLAADGIETRAHLESIKLKGGTFFVRVWIADQAVAEFRLYVFPHCTR